MRKIWLDTDPGVDDTMALAMLNEVPERVEILGASTVFGNAEIEHTTRNIKLLFEAAGLAHLPVSRGASAPLGIPLETGAFVHGDNGLGNMPLPEPSMPEIDQSAPQAIIDVILKNPDEITLFPIGPLTNVAMAYLLEPKIAELVKEVVIMGGAVFCPGNVTPAAEANFYHDPHAAQIVVRAGWPIVLAGLDVVDCGMLSQEMLDKISAAQRPLNHYIAGCLPYFQNFLKTIGMQDEAHFPDTLAAAYLLKPEIFKSEYTHLFVETEGSCKGQSVPVHRENWFEDLDDTREFSTDKNIGRVNVLLDADNARFHELVEDLLI